MVREGPISGGLKRVPQVEEALAQNLLSTIMQALVVIGSLAFFAIGAYGISHRERGVGLQVRCFVLIFRQCIICSLTVPSLNVCYRPS